MRIGIGRTVLAAFVLLVACSGSSSRAPAPAGCDPNAAGTLSVLVFSRTTGFRHGSIAAGIDAICKLGEARTWSVVATEDPAAFSASQLVAYDVVVWLNTTGDVLDAAQESAFQAYIEGGGGYVGVHSAADTEYDWAFYGTLVGAYFASHPAIQQATIRVEDATHPATSGVPATWVRTDEWYNYRSNPRGSVTVLATLDEATYAGGAMGSDHPILWYHEPGLGRAFYSGLGHTSESYGEAAFLAMLEGAILWAGRAK